MIYYYTKETFQYNKGLSIFNLLHRTGYIVFKIKTNKKLLTVNIRIKPTFKIAKFIENI